MKDMNLKQFYEKEVEIHSVTGKKYTGFINDYFYPDDNENGKESIIIDAVNSKYPVELYESDIAEIKVI